MYLGPYQRPAQLHSATAQQSPQGSSMKGLCAVVGIGTTAVLHSVPNMLVSPTRNCGVGDLSQRQDPTQMVLRRSGI